MATLYIVATPIGNLNDITLRALETLRSVDTIICEDTRVTTKLLAHFEISRPLMAYHQHSSEGVIAKIATLLLKGQDIALVSDAGTPGINDPGGRLVQELLSLVPDIQVVSIPGANAAITALSVSGFPADKFIYLGFVPHKKGRQTLFSDIAATEETVVFYESKHRITKTLASLSQVAPERPIMVARELTKKFETLYRGTPAEVLVRITGDDTLGEFVVVIAPKNWK